MPANRCLYENRENVIHFKKKKKSRNSFLSIFFFLNSNCRISFRNLYKELCKVRRRLGVIIIYTPNLQ